MAGLANDGMETNFAHHQIQHLVQHPVQPSVQHPVQPPVRHSLQEADPQVAEQPDQEDNIDQADILFYWNLANFGVPGTLPLLLIP